ncbi:MAG: hypothetical protein WCN95_11550, partial [bacterium]
MTKTMICAGIDAGSRTIKVVLLEGESRRILASGVTDQGVKQVALAKQLLGDVLRKARVSRQSLHRIVATG